MKEAPVRGGSGEYIESGTHVLALVAAKYIAKTQTDNLPAYITEFRVVESTHHPIGATVSWVLKRKQDPRKGGEEMFFTDLLTWTAALCGLDPALDKATIEGEFRQRADALAEAIATQGAMIGTLVRCLAQQRTSKQGNPWTKLTWTPYRRGDVVTIEAESTT